MATKLSEEAKKRKIEYNMEYARKNFQGKYITFNKTIPADIELYEWMKNRKEPANAYIKRLIREDMEKTLAEAKQNV